MLPKQNPHYRVDVRVRGKMIKGTIVRNDAVEPHVVIIKLDRGYTFVLGEEVEYSEMHEKNMVDFKRHPRIFDGERSPHE